MPSISPTETSYPALVGVLWSAPRAGEEAIVRAAGSVCWPFELEGPTHANLALIVQAARAAGHEVPDHFHFHAGQVFYHDSHPEEVRLAGGILGASHPAGHPTFTPWSTPTRPTVTVGPDGTLILDRIDAGRTHLSALVIESKEPEGRPAVVLLWDLRANVSAHSMLETQPGSHPSPMQQAQHVRVMSAAHYQAAREALYKNTFQRVEGSPWPTALLATGPARGLAQLRPVVMDTMPLMPPEEVEVWAQRMWRQREELSDLDADALDALSALWLYQARSAQDAAVADIDALLLMRGLKPKQNGQGRQGGYRPEQRSEMLQALTHIQNLWLNMAEVDVYEASGPGRRRRPIKHAIQSRAFVITDRMGQLQLDGNMDMQKFIFRPGDVFARFLFGPGRQTALLSAQALYYDPIRHMWEKRLARYVSYQWRCRAHNGNYIQPYRVATLLEAVGTSVNLRYPTRTKARLEKALDTLQQDGVIAGWQYDRWEEALTGHRGWAHHWCQATILIEPPDIIRDTYQQLERYEEPQRKLLPPPAVLGERVKQRRKALGLSQLQAAEYIGISPSYFNLLEHGKRGKKPSAAVLKELERWLADNG